MAQIWYNRIFDGTRSLDDVPTSPYDWKSEVIVLIENKYLNNEINKIDYNRMMGIVEEEEIDENSLIDQYLN